MQGHLNQMFRACCWLWLLAAGCWLWLLAAGWASSLLQVPLYPHRISHHSVAPQRNWIPRGTRNPLKAWRSRGILLSHRINQSKHRIKLESWWGEKDSAFRLKEQLLPKTCGWPYFAERLLWWLTCIKRLLSSFSEQTNNISDSSLVLF